MEKANGYHPTQSQHLVLSLPIVAAAAVDIAIVVPAAVAFVAPVDDSVLADRNHDDSDSHDPNRWALYYFCSRWKKLKCHSY